MAPVRQRQHPADSAAGERLWNSLCKARDAGLAQQVAELQDAVFRFYLPMARTLAHGIADDCAAERIRAEEAAELGLALAVLEWRQPTCGGFRRFARSSMIRQLSRD
jgi:hypothetical protein